MELFDPSNFNLFVSHNYKLISNQGIPETGLQDVSVFCNTCGVDVYAKVKLCSFTQTLPDVRTMNMPSCPIFYIIIYECPKCHKRSYALIAYFVLTTHTGGNGKRFTYESYLITSIPLEEENPAVINIPSEHILLVKTIKEAIYDLEHGQYISSAIMYRKAIQILAKTILGAKGGRLIDQLKWLEKNPNTLGIDLTDLFHENADLIREVGNQAAHPDLDPDLYEFTKEDAFALHNLFNEINSELFIKPAALKKIKEDLKNRRKLS